MANPAKARGTRWESSGVAYLNGALDYSHPADWRLIKRQAQEGAKDVGDAHAWPFILEFKDVKSPAVPTWLRQADTEAVNAGFPYGVVIHKVRGKGPALARVHITDATFLRLAADGLADWDPQAQMTFPTLNARGGYWTWTLADFAQVLQTVRGTSSPVQP